MTTRKRLQRTRERLREALASVEVMLRASRPGPAFTVACVAALAAGRAVDASAATSASPSPSPSPSPSASPSRGGIGAKVAVGVGVTAVIVAVVIISRMSATSAPSSTSTPTPTSTSTPSSTSRSASPSTSRSMSPSVAPSSSTSRSSRSKPGALSGGALPASIRRISAADRAALLDRIRTRRASGAAIEPKVYDFSDVSVDDATPVANAPPVDDTPIPALTTKTTLRRAISRLHPMLRACTDAATHGRLAVKARIVGEPGGTVVESVDITGDPPLSDDADFVECVRTTLESLELPPTNDTIPWDVHYPFIF